MSDFAATDHACEPNCPVCENRAEMERLAEEMLPAYVENDPPAASADERRWEEHVRLKEWLRSQPSENLEAKDDA